MVGRIGEDKSSTDERDRNRDARNGDVPYKVLYCVTHGRFSELAASLCVELLEHVLAADFDFALVLAGLREIVGKLHP